MDRNGHPSGFFSDPKGLTDRQLLLFVLGQVARARGELRILAAVQTGRISPEEKDKHAAMAALVAQEIEQDLEAFARHVSPPASG